MVARASGAYYVEAICPYCCLVSREYVQDPCYTQTFVASCNVEDGGCDRQYVVQAVFQAEVKTLKIEGEDEGSDVS